ncbi:4708_t:CDS:10 [Funneliformis geosporum]|uniref:4708_t:CDS:1 n=1 Tax=Funneliformis geosporum TaxID=1117311 RepID=A0A9W4SNI3_9GLOM|nr:4708_t:CDS:10 [Funneliformis geosporum]
MESNNEQRTSQLDAQGCLAEDIRCNIRTRGYLPIENYGLVGNLRTVALCGTDGHFSISPTIHTSNKQQYLPGSNILSTRFLHDEGVSEITDYMHIPEKSSHSISQKPILPWLIRHVSVVRGQVDFQFELFPSFNYALDEHTTEIEEYKVTENKSSKYLKDDVSSYVGHQRAIFRSNTLCLDLRYVVLNGEKDPPVIEFKLAKNNVMKGPGIIFQFTLKETQTVTFVLREFSTKLDQLEPPLSAGLTNNLYRQTLHFWQNWIAQSCYKGRWRENVHRSALALKLMTYEPTGAVVASPTFGLPEEIGGPRNWDYRFTWVRDSAFTVYALMRLGMTQEAKHYMDFMEARCQDLNPDGSLNIMYSIDGEKKLTEVELTHLDGYRGSKPVRIGNGAYDHVQLDIYGELLDAMYLYNKYGSPISYDMWVNIRKLVNYVCDNWESEDMSIWEVRGRKQNFTYSKIMWLRLSEKRVLPCPDRNKWMQIRDTIYEEIMSKTWNPKRKIFAQSYEALDALDSSVLIMPLVFFISPTDPRFLSTMEQILLPPEKGGLLTNNLVFRYNHLTTDDGLGGMEGSFSMCTFWLIEALTRAGKYDKKLLERAEFMFEQMISYGNHVGLFSEEIARSGELLGNFPQAFTHIAFISDINPLHDPLSLSKPFRPLSRISKDNFLKLLPTFSTTSSSNANGENDINDDFISYHNRSYSLPSVVTLSGATSLNDDVFDEINSEQECLGSEYRKDKFFIRLKSSIKKYLGVGKDRKRHQEAHHQNGKTNPFE